MNAQPEWDDLHVFLAVAREGGLSAAARSLGVNHATVSRRIARLERQLAVRLFDRGQRGYSPTLAGSELVPHAEAIEAEVLAIGRRLAGRDQRLEGSVRITTVDDMAELVLPEYLVGFRALHPGVAVSVDVTGSFASLAKMHADIAIRFGTPPDEPGSVRRRLATVGMRLYASRAYLAHHPTPKTPADLWQHAIVRGDRGQRMLPGERFMDHHADPAKIALRSDTMQVRVMAVRAGLGIGMLSTFAADPLPELVRLDVPQPDVRSGLWLGMHSDVRKAARVRALADYLYARFTEEKDRFAPDP